MRQPPFCPRSFGRAEPVARVASYGRGHGWALPGPGRNIVQAGPPRYAIQVTRMMAGWSTRDSWVGSCCRHGEAYHSSVMVALTPENPAHRIYVQPPSRNALTQVRLVIEKEIF